MLPEDELGTGIEQRSHAVHLFHQLFRVGNPIIHHHIQAHSHFIRGKDFLAGNVQLLDFHIENLTAHLPAVVPEIIRARAQTLFKTQIIVQKACFSVLNRNLLVVFSRHQIHVNTGKGILHTGLGNVHHLEFVLFIYIPEQCFRPGEHLPVSLIHKTEGNTFIRNNCLYHP